MIKICLAIFISVVVFFFVSNSVFAWQVYDCNNVNPPYFVGSASSCPNVGTDYNTCYNNNYQYCVYVSSGGGGGGNSFAGCCNYPATPTPIPPTPTPIPALPACPIGTSAGPGLQYVCAGPSCAAFGYTSASSTYSCASGECCIAPVATPTPTPPPAICGGGPVSYCNGGASSFYCCGSGMYCNPPNPVDTNFTCSSTPPAPTPVPGGVCSPNLWCGSQCLSACHTSDLYCNSTGSACNVQTGDFVGCWCGCTDPTICGATPTSPPPPPPPPSGGTCPGTCRTSPAGGACPGGTWAYEGGTCSTGTCQYCAVSGLCKNQAEPCNLAANNCCYGMVCQTVAGAGDICQSRCGFGCTPPDVCTNITSSMGLGFVGWMCYSPPPPTPVGPTPTPIPSTYTISGTVYVDTNGNGVQDPGELGKSGVSISRGAGVSTTTGGSGTYSFTGLLAGSYTVTMAVPAGYTATTANPTSKTLGPSTTANFGVRLVPLPACSPASLSANPTTVNPGGTSSLSVSGCINTNNPAVPPGNWNPNAGGNCAGASITNTLSNATSATATWNAPACPATSLICTTSVGVSGPGGTTTYSANITVNAAYTVTANVRDDLLNNGCASGSSAYSGSATLSLVNTGTGATINQNTVTGSTTFTCQNTGNYNLSTTVPTGYRITNRTVSPGGFGLVLNNGVSFAMGPSQTATFCISKVNPWYQTTTGDVRKVSITNKVPAGFFASSDPVSPSLFISSNWNSDFGNGAASALGWKADAEYDYNKNSLNRNGTANYSYYISRLNQTGVTPTTLANCNATSCALTNLATGIYTATGPITITQYSQAAGAHVVLLVNGDATIKSSIKVPAGAHNLFVLAAKGNVTIDRSVGEALFTSSVTDVEGVITAEGSVTADGTQCNGGTPDLRLNIGGTVVANALKPFATAGTGVFTNNRSLCANDLTTPSVTFSPRFDFITELTDFYRTISSRWKEVQP